MKFLLVAVLVAVVAASAHRPARLSHLVCEDAQCNKCETVMKFHAHDCVETPSGHHFQSYCRGNKVVHAVFAKAKDQKCSGNKTTSMTPAEQCLKRGDKFHKTQCHEQRRHHQPVVEIKPRVAGQKVNSTIKAAPSFSVCNKAGALLSNVKLTSSSNDWQPGQRVFITMSGDLSQTVTEGTLHAQAWFVGIEVLNSSDNLCTYEGTPFKCPLAKGPYTVEIPFDVPSPPFGGELTANMEMTDKSGAEIACINFALNL